MPLPLLGLKDAGWLRAHLTITKHQLAVEAALRSNADAADVANLMAQPARKLELLALDLLRREHGAPTLTAQTSRVLYSFVKKCEAEYFHHDMRALGVDDYTSTFDGISYAPFAMPRTMLRSASAAASDGPYSGIRAAGALFRGFVALNILVRWHPIAQPLRIVHAQVEDLEWIREQSAPVRIGLAPFVAPGDLAWDTTRPHPQDAKGRWIRCTGPNDAPALQERVRNVVRAARASKLDLLIFPELSICADIEQSLLEELRAPTENTLRLVVAGSAHEDANGGFVNRARAYSGRGTELWRQEKMLTFSAMMDKVPVYEPEQTGMVFQIRESSILGRLGITICADFCRRDNKLGPSPLWMAMQGCLITTLLVPALQADGDLTTYRTSAEGLRDSHAATSLVCNMAIGNGLPPCYVCTPDRTAISADEIPSVPLHVYSLLPISTHQLVNLKEKGVSSGSGAAH